MRRPRAWTSLVATIATVAAALLAAWLVSLAATLRAAWVQQHLGHGFLPTLVFDLQSCLATVVLPVAAGVIVISVLAAWRARRGGPTGPAGPVGSVAPFVFRLLAIAAGAALFLRLGYTHNRHGFGSYWGRRHDLGSIRLPEALFRWEVWRTNLLITLGALAVALVAFFLLRLTLGRRADAAGRLWRALGRPIALIAGVLLVTGTPLLAGALRARRADLPSFILVSLDTLRADRLGIYGCERPTSPRIDALAGESIVFDRAMPLS